jgi:hypothetical protein
MKFSFAAAFDRTASAPQAPAWRNEMVHQVVGFYFLVINGLSNRCLSGVEGPIEEKN